MGIQGSGRRVLGNKVEACGIEGKGRALISHDVSSLVIDRLCDQARGQNTTVACFTSTLLPRRSSPPRARWAPC